MAPPDDDISAGSILRELIFNQYQAIVAGGAALASVLTLNPLPLLVWLGAELVLLPILDSGPLRRLVARRRREAARAPGGRAPRQPRSRRSMAPTPKRYAAMEQLCRMIEANYQGLSGISQAYLSEQRGKLDNILDGCLNRMLALQRYEKMPIGRNPPRSSGRSRTSSGADRAGTERARARGAGEEPRAEAQAARVVCRSRRQP